MSSKPKPTTIDKTQPNTFARYAEVVNSGNQALLLSMETHSAAEKFPCSVCDGEGFLVQTIRYSTRRQFSTFLKKRGGDDLVLRRYMYCPCCFGMGFDEREYILKHNGQPQAVQRSDR